MARLAVFLLSKPLPSIERHLYFSDYRVAGGLTWPHRCEEIVDGSVVLDTRLGTFKINPKIDPKRFD